MQNINTTIGVLLQEWNKTMIERVGLCIKKPYRIVEERGQYHVQTREFFIWWTIVITRTKIQAREAITLHKQNKL